MRLSRRRRSAEIGRRGALWRVTLFALILVQVSARWGPLVLILGAAGLLVGAVVSQHVGPYAKGALAAWPLACKRYEQMKSY